MSNLNSKNKCVTVSIQAHCSDSFSATFKFENDTTKDYDGYVPDIFGVGGDDVILTIDNATGQILNWQPLTNDNIAEILEEHIDEEE